VAAQSGGKSSNTTLVVVLVLVLAVGGGVGIYFLTKSKGAEAGVSSGGGSSGGGGSYGGGGSSWGGGGGGSPSMSDVLAQSGAAANAGASGAAGLGQTLSTQGGAGTVAAANDIKPAEGIVPPPAGIQKSAQLKDKFASQTVRFQSGQPSTTRSFQRLEDAVGSTTQSLTTPGKATAAPAPASRPVNPGLQSALSKPAGGTKSAMASTGLATRRT
jgi:hypothetical protein